MPATKMYGGQGPEPETIRDRFVAAYGEDTVRQAELQVVLDLFMLMGVCKPAEFVEVLTRKLERVDRLRRAQAGIES